MSDAHALRTGGRAAEDPATLSGEAGDTWGTTPPPRDDAPRAPPSPGLRDGSREVRGRRAGLRGAAPAPAPGALALAALGGPPSGALQPVPSACGRGGLPEQALAPFLAPLRAGDPLGLGLAPGARPPPPPDPDPYDRAREDAEFARSLLGEPERAALDEELAQEGFLTPDKVRAIVAGNTVKGSVEAGGLDPEVLALIDARVDYKLFVAGDNLYTRAELYDHYPFHELGVQPEAVFAQQEIGVFPPRQTALTEELEYVVRDVGDESVDFVMIEDLVGQATRAGYRQRRAPLRVVKTKIYVGKERWDDFLLLQRFFRGAVRVAQAQIAYGGASPAGAVSPVFALLAGGRAAPAPLAIADPATLEAERAARAAEAARREDEFLSELRRREDEFRRREDEARRAAAETQRKLDADLRRIEAMLAAVTQSRAAPGARPGDAGPGGSGAGLARAPAAGDPPAFPAFAAGPPAAPRAAPDAGPDAEPDADDSVPL